MTVSKSPFPRSQTRIETKVSVTPLPEQLAETCILQCYVIETIDGQLDESRLRHQTEIHAVIDRMLEVLHQHTTQLAVMLEPLPASQNHQGAEAWLAARTSNFVRRTPRSEIRAMLLDDCALLNLTAMHYRMILNSAVAAHDEAAKALASEHLDELLKLTQQIATILPPASPVVHEPVPVPKEAPAPRFPVSVWQTTTTAA